LEIINNEVTTYILIPETINNQTGTAENQLNIIPNVTPIINT
jgi:hypothetical protein